ncbi:MAG: hypothetical protein DSM106950_25405 [Stigonema ocellatum SAG 48.90 = DSM 106950]|nr:hypothetical protein [Stigonema ocellatum SAG 48.90 = DSM 106950]
MGQRDAAIDTLKESAKLATAINFVSPLDSHKTSPKINYAFETLGRDAINGDAINRVSTFFSTRCLQRSRV